MGAYFPSSLSFLGPCQVFLFFLPESEDGIRANPADEVVAVVLCDLVFELFVELLMRMVSLFPFPFVGKVVLYEFNQHFIAPFSSSHCLEAHECTPFRGEINR